MKPKAMTHRMPTPRRSPGRFSILVPVGFLMAMTMALPRGECQSSVVQSFDLKPGWNTVFLEVTPEDRNVESAFAGIPIASVWTWMPDDETVQFIQDPTEERPADNGWYCYFPRPRPEAFLTNLFVLQANRAYLIKLDGNQPITWNVAGTPSLRAIQWIPDSFNLVGFHIDPSRPPTFGAYLADRSALENGPVYRLGAGGSWELIEQPYSESIESGEAYWVFCKGTTDFDGPMEVSVEWSDRIDFGSSLASQLLVVRNRTVIDVDITLHTASSQIPVPLSLMVKDEETGRENWTPLPTTYSIPAPAGQELLLKFGVRRADLTADDAGGILEVRNGLGARRLVPVFARRYHAPPPGQAKAGRASGVATFAGLWQGTVLVDAVSEAQHGETTPKKAGMVFPLRVLIHVDSVGTTRLLNEVIEMWQDGTVVPDPENPDYLTTETPGRAVLLTNEDLIPQFTGIVMRDDSPVGIRMSSVAYDFPGDTLEMNGDFSPTGTLEATLTMDSNFPTNPFKHRYHPDHNNLDEQFLNPVQEAYEVTRRIRFVFSATDPEEKNEPDWGDSLLAGQYFEEISGLHRNTIYVAGTFRMRRVAGVPELNQ